MDKDNNILHTFGCRMNTFESNYIHDILHRLNMDKYIVINTCAITAESERQCRQMVRRLHREHPEHKIIITGCSSQNNKKKFLDILGVDFVIGNDLKLKDDTYNKINIFFKTFDKIKSSNESEYVKQKKIVQSLLFKDKDTYIPNNNNNNFNEDVENHFINTFEDRSRAFVPIQTGCNHFCSFCIVPFTRGNFKSYPVENIIRQIQLFLKNGYNEVVLTGIDITDYGKDRKQDWDINSLGKLCKEILSKTDLPRLRLSSVDVAEIDNDIMDLIKNEPRFMPYFHISLQSGSNSVLQRMKRRHTREDVLSFCSEVLKLRPDSAFGADIIAGFPEETTDDFLQSVDLVKEAPISFVHAFPYSRRERTLAFSMDDNVSKTEKKRRVNMLIKLGEENLQLLYSKMARKTHLAIVERNRIARAENFAQILLDKKLENNFLAGSLVKVFTDVYKGQLVATKVESFKY